MNVTQRGKRGRPLRLKVAVLLGFLDGRLCANDEDWELSGHIMDASDRTRDYVAAELASERTRNNRSRAEAPADLAVTVNRKVTEEQIGRIARVIARAVVKAGPDGIASGKARSKVSGKDRERVTEAIDFAVAAGWVKEQEKPHGNKPDKTVVWLVPGESSLRPPTVPNRGWKVGRFQPGL